MIHLHELISDEKWLSASLDHKFNLQQLHYKLNFVRALYAKPMIVTSGYRSKEDHFRIYKEINDKRLEDGKKELTIPWGSNHLIGSAADIHDPFGSLKKWVLDNLDVVEQMNLYLEKFEATGGLDSGWLHFAIYPPKSGHRFFNP